MKLSHSISKQKTSSLPELTDVGHEDLTESMAEVKFLRNQSPSSLEFYKNMRKFSRELSQHNKFIRNAKINPKNHSYIKIQSKCKSFTSKTIRNLPKLSPKLIKYGIEMNLLREDEIKGLIVDPNKYSIFFEDQDLDSPYTINALKNLKIKQELITFPNFKDFEDPNLPKLTQIVSYLIDLNKKYELFKLVLKERNRLRFLDLEIKRKFPFCTSQSLDETTKSIQSLNETLNKPIEAHLKLYQNHSLTYTFEEKKQRNQQKLDNLKETMLNYIQNMTANRFDGEFFLQQSSEKQRKVLNKKAEKLKNIRKTARNFIEPVNKKLEDHLLNKSSGHLKEEFKDKMKEIDFQNEKHQQRVEREKEKLNEKIEKLVSKREEYKLKGESIRFELAQKDSFRIQSKLKDYEEKNNLMTLQRELNVAKQLKNINLHEKRLEINRQKVLKQMQEKEQKLINDFMGDFQHKYENSLMKKQEVIKKNLFKLTNESKSYVETIQLNRERILERQKDKEDYFKQKLNNDTEKVARAQNIKEFIRRKTIIQEEDRFKKNREKKEEHDLMFDKKKVTIVLKEVQNKRKINFNKKENDFVVEERRDYSNKLSNYREVMLKNIKV